MPSQEPCTRMRRLSFRRTAAALDPFAEVEVYENFNTLVQDKTVVYISHRMSSCKFCDRIVVLDGGADFGGGDT